MTISQPPLQRFPCSSCGANLEFNPGVSRMKCPYCGHDEEIPQVQGKVAVHDYDEQHILNHAKTALLSPQALEVDCPGCRAVVTFEPPQVAGACPFCGTNIVAPARSAHPGMTPDGVLPFKIGQKQARSLIQRWINRLWFAPTSLKQLAQHQKLQGVYLPFWMYHSNTITHYRGERGDAYYVTVTRTRTNSEGKQETYQDQERRIRWRRVSGTVRCSFHDLLVAATQSLNEKRLHELEPWPMQAIAPYQEHYLAGFKAQRYQVNVLQGFDIAKTQMAPGIRSAICRDIGGDEQRIHSSDTTYHDTKFSHLLMPVWMGAYRYHNKQYQVMVNAQTGEVLGDRPWSIWKIVMAVMASLLTAGGLWLIDSGRLGDVIFPEPEPEPPVYVDPQPVQSAPPPTLPSSPVPVTPSYPPAAPAADEAFRQAINIAGQAAALTQTAQTPQQWQQVSSLWIRALELLNQVPPSSSNYAAAQQRIQQYQQNLKYARQQAQS